MSSRNAYDHYMDNDFMSLDKVHGNNYRIILEETKKMSESAECRKKSL